MERSDEILKPTQGEGRERRSKKANGIDVPSPFIQFHFFIRFQLFVLEKKKNNFNAFSTAGILNSATIFTIKTEVVHFGNNQLRLLFKLAT